MLPDVLKMPYTHSGSKMRTSSVWCSFAKDWRPLRRVNTDIVIMQRIKGNAIQFSPLVVHSVKMAHARTHKEQSKINQTIPATATMSEKLRHYRHQASLYQIELAEKVGLHRTTYSYYEGKEMGEYPIETLVKIAACLNVDIKLLLDDYHLFLYEGQGAQTKSVRTMLMQTQEVFAENFGVTRETIKRWENEKARISRKDYDLLMALSNFSLEDTSQGRFAI